MLAICGRAIDHRYNVLLVYLLGAIGNRWMCVSAFLFFFNNELRFRCDEYMCSVLDAIPHIKPLEENRQTLKTIIPLSLTAIQMQILHTVPVDRLPLRPLCMSDDQHLSFLPQPLKV